MSGALLLPLDVLRDLLARLVRALDAVRDGEVDLAESILDDLAVEVRGLVGAAERRS